MSVFQSLRALWREWSQRRMLATVDGRTLADLGICRAQARFEAERMPWNGRNKVATEGSPYVS